MPQRLIPLIVAALLASALSSASAQPNVRASSASLRAEQTFQQLLGSGKFKLSRNQVTSRRISLIGDAIARVARRPIPWNFYLVDDPKANAFTPGEGVVVLTEGLLDIGLDDDELAGVIAHEIAHGTEQHRDFKENTSNKVNGQLRALKKEYSELSASYRSGRISRDVYNSRMHFIQRQLDDLEKDLAYLEGQQRHEKDFNHEREIEADLVGMRYAVAAGYKAEGLRSALRKLLERNVQKFGSSYTGEGFSHPSTARRLEVLERVQNQLR